MPVLLLICTLSPAAAGTWPKMLPVVDCAKEGVLTSARLAATAAASVRNGNAKVFFILGTLVIASRTSSRDAREVGVASQVACRDEVD
jgi:hypothetical protein